MESSENCIKIIFVNSLDSVEVNRGDSESFRIDVVGEEGCHVIWVFNMCVNRGTKEEKMRMGRVGIRFTEEGKNKDYLTC